MYWFICTTHPRKPTDPLILPICSSCFFREIKFRRSGLEHPTGLDGVAGLMFIMCIYIYRHMWWNSSSCFFVETKRDKPSALQELMADEHVFWVMRLRHTANFNWRQCSCSFPTSCNNDNGILTTLTAAGTVFNKCPKLVFSNFFSHHFGTPHLRTQNTPKILKDKSPYVIKIWYALLFSNWW